MVFLRHRLLFNTYVDDSGTTQTQTLTADPSKTLGGVNTNMRVFEFSSSTYSKQLKIYYFTIKKLKDTIMHLIPVYYFVDETKVEGMYDLISGQFFGDART